VLGVVEIVAVVSDARGGDQCRFDITTWPLCIDMQLGPADGERPCYALKLPYDEGWRDSAGQCGLDLVRHHDVPLRVWAE